MLCTNHGAENTSKKTLDSVQNIENKRSEIFLPPRSMVLKVVRGKILETLELRCLALACGFTLEPLGSGAKRRSGDGLGVPAHSGCALDQIVKDSMIISEIICTSLCYRKWLGRIKKKAEDVAGVVSNRESRAQPARGHWGCVG